MADLDSVIAAAMTAAGGGDVDGADAGGADGVDAGTDSGSTGDAGVEAAGSVPTGDGTAEPALAADGAPPAAIEPMDEIAKELEALGLIKGVAGKDNRIPYSRVAKIVENARKRAQDAATAEAEPIKTKLSEAEKRLQTFDAVDQLAASDPERYLTLLAGLNPAYQKFLTQQQAPKPADKQPPAAAKPQPDVKFSDGTMGYSPEQHDQLMSWHTQQAEERAFARAKAEYDSRVGPIEQRFQAQQAMEQRMPAIRAQLQQAQDTWGDLLTKHEAEVTKYLADNPRVSFEAGVAKVLTPKLRADRTTMRGELLKELEARPKAAAPAAPAATKASSTSSEPRSLNDVIRESMAALR